MREANQLHAISEGGVDGNVCDEIGGTDHRVIAVQKCGGDEARADEQELVVLLAVVADQREAADGKRQYCRDRFHQGMQLAIAEPC